MALNCCSCHALVKGSQKRTSLLTSKLCGLVPTLQWKWEPLQNSGFPLQLLPQNSHNTDIQLLKKGISHQDIEVPSFIILLFCIYESYFVEKHSRFSVWQPQLLKRAITLLSFLAERLKSIGPGPTAIPSISEPSQKTQVLVMARLSGCCVTTAVGVMHRTLGYFPLHVNFVQRNLPTHSGGMLGSLLVLRAANR